MTISNMFKRGGSLVNHLGRKWSADAVTHLGQKMKHNLNVIGRKAAGHSVMLVIVFYQL